MLNRINSFTWYVVSRSARPGGSIEELRGRIHKGFHSEQETLDHIEWMKSQPNFELCFGNRFLWAIEAKDY
jgi:hypothetical protein